VHLVEQADAEVDLFCRKKTMGASKKQKSLFVYVKAKGITIDFSIVRQFDPNSNGASGREIDCEGENGRFGEGVQKGKRKMKQF
jgi:hypothetical protein